MIKQFAILFLLSASLHAVAQSDAIAVAGSASYGNISVPGLITTGTVELNGTHVDGSTYTSGSLTAINAQLNKLSVAGDSNIRKTTVNGLTTISGHLVATDSVLRKISVPGTLQLNHSVIKEGGHVAGHFEANDSEIQGPLIISANKAHFNRSQTQSIQFKSINTPFHITLFGKQLGTHQDHIQHIYLTDTIVHGNIKFNSGKGEIILKGNSVIDGKVEGGVIKHTE